MSKENIFLSGWEYNRVLAEDPGEPQQSGLPGAALWNGGAQFWLFKKVYCTKESLDGEIAATEAVGYAQGKIFNSLRSEGFIEPVSWHHLQNLAPYAYTATLAAHRRLKEEFSEGALREFVKTGNTRQLDQIKFELLAPLMGHLKCVQNISPNSVQHWLGVKPKSDQNQNRVDRAIQALVQPVTESDSDKLGLTLCHKPGKHSVTMEQMVAQREVEQTIEKRQIAELFLGKLSARDYLHSLEPYAAIYQPINSQLLSDWNLNKEKLFRLRDLAEKYVWKDLHTEWLPQLELVPSFQDEFRSLLKKAVRHSKMAGFLDLTTNLGSCFVGGAVAVLGERLGMPGPMATAAGAGAVYSIRDAVKKERAPLEGLTLFYQKARELRNAPVKK